MDKTIIFYITSEGRNIAGRIAKLHKNTEILKFNPRLFVNNWKNSKNIICIMAAGIVVRTAAPLLKDKKTDPAVVVLDEKGKYVISLLSGHIGGANALARKIADFLGAQAVITTSSDVQGKVALDMWAMEKKLFIEDFDKLKKISAKIANGGKIKIYSECPYDASQMPDEFIMVDSQEKSEIIISHRLIDSKALFMRPGNLFIGIGCNRGTSSEEIDDMTKSVFERERLSFSSVNSIATIDLKKDEQGLIGFAGDNKIQIEFFSKNSLNDTASKHNIEESDAVKTATGAAAVAEPAAVLSAERVFGSCTIITPKEKRGNVTLAVAKAEFML